LFSLADFKEKMNKANHEPREFASIQPSRSKENPEKGTARTTEAEQALMLEVSTAPASWNLPSNPDLDPSRDNEQSASDAPIASIENDMEIDDV